MDREDLRQHLCRPSPSVCVSGSWVFFNTSRLEAKAQLMFFFLTLQSSHADSDPQFDAFMSLFLVPCLLTLLRSPSLLMGAAVNGSSGHWTPGLTHQALQMFKSHLNKKKTTPPLSDPGWPQEATFCCFAFFLFLYIMVTFVIPPL